MTEAEQLAEKVASMLFGPDEVPVCAIPIIVWSILECRPMETATSRQLHECADELRRALLARNAAIAASRTARNLN